MNAGRITIVVIAVELCACGARSNHTSHNGTIAGLALPSRRPAGQEAQNRLPKVVDRVAKRLSARVVGIAPRASAPELNIETALQRARELELAGSFDEAAASYDLSLEEASQALGYLRKPALFVTASVARASIALVRKEQSVAERILGRLLAYDPGFALRTQENRPSLRQALSSARDAPAAVTPELLGRQCESSQHLVVARAAQHGKIELLRLRECKVVASTLVQRSASDEAIAAALTPDTAHQRKPWYGRWWVWAAAGIAAGSVAVTLAITTGDQGVNVVPHP